MTKGELLRLLEPFTDDIEILVDLTQEYTKITITRPIEAVTYVRINSYDAEVLLKVGQ